MGYSEVHCFICGVSFNIARLRTSSEPRSHAWDRGGGSEIRGDGSEFCAEYPSEACSESTGCSFVDRNRESDEFHPVGTDLETIECVDDGFGLEHIAGLGCGADYGYNGHYVSGHDIGMSRTAQCILRKNPADDPIAQLDPPDREALWQPAHDDEPWESISAWFLTGLNTQIEERHRGPSRGWRPLRHGATDFEPDDCNYVSVRSGTRMAMIFHPRCMEVYQRAAFARTGKVDIDGLGEWWERRDELGESEWYTRCMGLNESDHQWWTYAEGTEMFTVDPLKDEKLMKMLRDAADCSKDFNICDSAFPARDHTVTTATINGGIIVAADPFLAFPAELSQQVLSYLPNSSIAALRASSRAFTHIPISFFFPLVRDEFPWIWEANCEISTALPLYSKWTKMAIEIAFERTPRFWEFVEHYDEDGHRTSGADARALISNTKSPEIHPNDECVQPPALPRLKTNWYKLYAALKKHGRSVPELRMDLESYWYPDVCSSAMRHHPDSIPGLWNRERIWRDCMEILRKIEAMRAADAVQH